MRAGLALLACGTQPAKHEIGEVLDYLALSIEQTISNMVWLRKQPDLQQVTFGPFLGRSLLELTMTSVIARIDPYRVITLRYAQLQEDYDTGVRRNASIQWQGDVVVDKNDVIPPDKMWTPQKKPHEIGRALLGDYFDQTLWRPALTRLIDAASSITVPKGDWFQDVISMTPESFISKARKDCGPLYSSLSKGVHQEFVIAPNKKYDVLQVRSLTQDSVKICGQIGLVSNYIGHVVNPVPSDNCASAMQLLQEAIEP